MPNPFAHPHWDDLPNSNASRGVAEPKRQHKPGHNRPKTTGDLLGQGLMLVVGLVALVFCMGNGYWLALVAIILYTGAYLSFQEWMSRCEDRTKVKRVLTVLWAILAALEVRHQYRSHQERERIEGGRRTAAPGSTNPLDYGDR